MAMRTRFPLAILAVLLAGALLSLSAQAGAPRFFITVQVTGQGTVVLDPVKPEGYQKNNIVTVTAVPGDGSHFVSWGGAVSGTANPTTLRVSGNHTVLATFSTGSGGVDPPPPPPPPDALPTSRLVVGYFAQWTIYRRGYLVKHVVDSGAVNHLNVINYAFAAPDAAGKCASLDTFADWGKRFDASESVDGVADSVSQPLKGNFNQLLKLKAINPNLRVLISLGGWTESYRFTDVARTDESRRAFVSSCIDMFIKGRFADGIVAPGVFDGIDVDWEYPGSCGATCGDPAKDPGNFAALLQEFRSQLDEQGALDKRDYLLTIAAPAGAVHYEPMGIEAIHSPVDWINVMAYDFHGGWEAQGPANHVAALYPHCLGETDWADKAIAAYRSAGVPAGKLLLGVPFYGRGWRGVAPVNDGLCQPAGGVPRGVYEKGVNDYEVLAASGDTDSWQESTGTHWTFDGNEFWSFDDATSAGWKADYANCRTLRGVMFWELSGDDRAGTLLDALARRLRDAASGCRTAWPPP